MKTLTSLGTDYRAPDISHYFQSSDFWAVITVQYYLFKVDPYISYKGPTFCWYYIKQIDVFLKGIYLSFFVNTI